MKCPYCGQTDTKVVDKRATEDSSANRRRRECIKCSKRFTTFERLEMVDLWVVKKDGSRQKFDKAKIKSGITKSCEKRPISIEKIDEAVDKIEAEILKNYNKEVKSSTIGNIIMKRLKTLDKVAYIRFASVYREFTDIDSFKEELDKLFQKKKK
ncbi:transcriptional regulator NrdR [Nanoarchaeota archaeon]